MQCIHSFDRAIFQDEKYDHIEAEEITKVEKAVAEKEQWLNDKWNAQSKLADHQDPAVYTSMILSEKKVPQPTVLLTHYTCVRHKVV